MKKLFLALCATGALTACETAPGQTTLFGGGETQARAATASADEASGTESSGDPDAIRCVREPVLGSRLRPQEICRTQREWDRIREAAREDVDRIQRSRVPVEVNEN